MPSDLAPLAGWLRRPVTVVDAGCRWGLTRLWATLGPAAQVIGFEPDAAECARLAADLDGVPGSRVVPLALGAATGSATLHLAREPACSSLYPAHPTALREHPGLALIAPVGTAEVAVTTLDDWAATEGVEHVDAMKLDTQGSELQILRGARRLLRGVRVLEVEVAFNPMYRNQPLFADVDRFLGAHGFTLWRLGHLVHYGRHGDDPALERDEHQFHDGRQSTFTAYGGQLYWGHAHYLHREIAFREAPPDWRDRLRDALLCGAIGFADPAEWSLRAALVGAPPEAAAAIGRALGA